MEKTLKVWCKPVASPMFWFMVPPVCELTNFGIATIFCKGDFLGTLTICSQELVDQVVRIMQDYPGLAGDAFEMPHHHPNDNSPIQVHLGC